MDGHDTAAWQDCPPSQQPTTRAYQRCCWSWDCLPLYRLQKSLL